MRRITVLFVVLVFLTPQATAQAPTISVDTTLTLLDPDYVALQYNFTAPPPSEQSSFMDHRLTVYTNGSDYFVFLYSVVLRQPQYIDANSTISVSQLIPDSWYYLCVRATFNGSTTTRFTMMFYVGSAPVYAPPILETMMEDVQH